MDQHDILYIYYNHTTMSSLTKQIVDELMEKFKNENPDTIIKIIQELRSNIRQSRVEQVSVY